MLDAELRAGSDMYFTEYENKTYSGSSLKNTYSIKQERSMKTITVSCSVPARIICSGSGVEALRSEVT